MPALTGPPPGKQGAPQRWERQHGVPQNCILVDRMDDVHHRVHTITRDFVRNPGLHPGLSPRPAGPGVSVHLAARPPKRVGL